MVLDLFYSMVLTALFLYVLQETTNAIIPWRKRIISVLIYGLLVFAISNINEIIKLAVLVIAFIEMAHRYLKINYNKAVSGGILGFVFLTIGDLTAGMLLQNLGGYTTQQIKNDPMISVIVYLVIVPMVVLVTMIYKRLNRLIGISRDVDIKNSTLSLAYIAIIIMLIAVMSQVYLLFPKGVNKIYLALFLGLIVMFVIVNLAVLYVNNRYLTQKNEYDQLRVYTGIVENLVSDIKRFRHNYSNIVLSINGFIENEDISGLKKYFNNEIVKEGNIISNKNMPQLKNIINPAVKGLVSSKIVKAENLGINLFVEIQNEIRDIPVKTIDICKIVGVVIDNAIEASVESDAKKMTIGMMDDDENIVILVGNSYKKIPKISDMFKEGFSTKGEGRGIGLASVKDIIDNNYKNIILNSFDEEGSFIQELNIKKNKKKAV